MDDPDNKNGRICNQFKPRLETHQTTKERPESPNRQHTVLLRIDSANQ
jgi:hypothetical protein